MDLLNRYIENKNIDLTDIKVLHERPFSRLCKHSKNNELFGSKENYIDEIKTKINL